MTTKTHDLAALSLKELVALYNSVSAKPVSKFADRAVALKRTAAALAAAQPQQKTKRRGRPSAKFSPDARIRVLAKTNPKRPGSAAAARFSLYEDKMTVAAYAARVGSAHHAWRDLVNDVAHEYVQVA